MQEVRCGTCNKLLAKASYQQIEIKCPRCRAINHLKAVEPPNSVPRAPVKEKPDGTDL